MNTPPFEDEGTERWNAYDQGWDSIRYPVGVNPYIKGTDLWEQWEIGRAESFAAANTIRVPRTDPPDYTPEIQAILIGVVLIGIAIGVSAWIMISS